MMTVQNGASNDNCRAPTVRVPAPVAVAIGSKYEATKGLDIAEVAKLVRADIKAAVASGELPEGSVASVRIQRFAGGKSITAVLAIPGVVRLSPEETEAGRSNRVPKPWLTRVAYNAEAAVERIVEAYNYDRSDSQSDSFNVRFYAHVSVEGAVVS